MESYVPLFYIIIATFGVEKTISFLPPSATRYKDLVAGAVCIGLTVALQQAGIGTDAVAVYNDIASTVATQIASGVLLWGIVEGWYEKKKQWREDRKLSERTGRPTDDETDGLPQEWER